MVNVNKILTERENNLIVRVDNLTNAKKEVVSDIQSYLRDRTLPIEDRWAIFCTVSHVLPCETYGDGFVGRLVLVENHQEPHLYDDFYYERHETVDYRYMADHMEGSGGTVLVTIDSLLEWKEAVMGAGYGSFVYDW